ncbi:hypothetical protein SAPIO_CDS2341 [Scedosporium apiospermum]|uniref:ABC transporter n=1 Tax=Pseudallescheria apiosperma TaxID=563466 RepID=A0A084GCA2_PSEDA|nr:uncharacterized protein SAPIO_CDS2341 [Scedosporium apiospermum]KEZ44964.1 hypothetical protein SAPIO_CDS2341 [Scedosporium apiospermum]
MSDDVLAPSQADTVVESAAPSARPKRTPKFSDYLRVFSYATKWDFCTYAIASIASIGAGVTLPLMTIIFGQLVDDFTDYFRESTMMSPDDLHAILNKQALYIMALFLGRWALNTINKFCFRMIGIRLSSAVRLHYLRSLFAQSIHVIDTMPPGAPATAITTTSNTLQLGISERLGTFLEYNGTIWAAFIVAFVWSWNITLVTCSLIIYTVVVLSVFLPSLVKYQTAMGEADTQSNAIASEALGGIQLVVACGAQSRVMTRYETWVRESLKRAMKMTMPASLQFGLTFFGVMGAFGLAFWYGIQRYIKGAITNPGVVIIVLMSVMMILTSLERVATPLMAVSSAMVAACQFFTVIDAPLPSSGSEKPDITSDNDLVFEGVTFAYPSRPNVKVLDDASFRIRSGQNTAIVGPSGSGKSTIVGLLERWYSLREQHVLPEVVEAKPSDKEKKTKGKQSEADNEKNDNNNEEPSAPAKPQLSGSIKVGGHDLETLDLTWWRAQIGLVQQEPFLFNDTIFGNVANGLIGTAWADVPEERKREMVKEACEEAYAHEFISRLPDGYETRVGDGGAKLSGGQKQRLAIARTIIKNPRIMILDEATSAMDTRSEKIVQAALDRVTQNRTTITIAHRLSTIKKADHIIVLQKGRAVEEGTHESLMARPLGVYSQLVNAQSLRLAGAAGGEADDVTPVATPDEQPGKLLYDNDKMADPEQPSPPSTDGGAPEKKPRSLMQSFGKALYMERAQWPFYMALVVAAMAMAAGTPIQAWLFAKVVGVFLLPNEDEMDREGDFWGLMWLALAVGVGLSYFAAGWLSLRTQYFISAVYRTKYFGAMLRQKVAFFDEDDNSHGSLSARVSGDAKQLEELLGLNLAFMLSGIFTVIGCVILALVFGWQLGLVATFITMPIMLSSGYWRYRHEMLFDKMNAAVFAESSQFATEALGAIRTVSSLTMESAINDRYEKLLNGHVREAFKRSRWTSIVFGFTASSSLGCQALIFWYGGRLLASGSYTLEAFLVCFMAAIQGAEGASQSIAIAPSAAQAKAAANRILDVLDAADDEEAARRACGGKISEAGGGVRIELRDVHFKYPTRDVDVFRGLNLEIEKGQFAAFVGPSGCGKTTIIALLERFYDLEQGKGEILFNGTNIKDVDVYDYRDNLSLVSQEPTLFRGTVRDNILMGVPDPDSISDERIHQVCRDAFIHDFIVSLPEGYDTDVGHKGLSMSGGQKQRIAIARALIRDPKVLLLDEATSALDSESEKVVQAALEKARSGRTMIAVAHRLSTIQNADVIFVFDNGAVVERGTHDDLLGKQGVYWGMCQSQALDH